MGLERSGRVRGRKDLPYGEMRDDRSRKSGCCKADAAVGFAEKGESSSYSGS